MTTDGELWHIVEAKRDDGAPTMFRIRELAPRRELRRIFVVEMPYPTTELSRMPNAAAYRRLSQFEEQWLVPACHALGWELVGSKTEDGSFFLYMYGASDPNGLIERISPFDAALGFYDDDDPDWTEYATLRELLDLAKAMPAANGAGIEELEADLGVQPAVDLTMATGLVAAPPRRKKATTVMAKPKARAKAKAKKAKAKPKPKKAKAKPQPKKAKPQAKAKTKPKTRKRRR